MIDLAGELRRHRLVRLHAEAWLAVREQVPGAMARDCVDFWAREDLPLVVTRQPGPVPPRDRGCAAPSGFPSFSMIATGLPAPDRWRRLRLSLVVPASAIRTVEAFPGGERIGALLPPEARPAWKALLHSLSDLGASLRIHGSYGWQWLTGLDDHVRAGSDLDLCVDVRDARQADRVVARLRTWNDGAAPRLDGELEFDDGTAVNWREWERWRSGAVAQILVRDLYEVTLQGTWPFKAVRPSTCGEAA